MQSGDEYTGPVLPSAQTARRVTVPRVSGIVYSSDAELTALLPWQAELPPPMPHAPVPALAIASIRYSPVSGIPDSLMVKPVSPALRVEPHSISLPALTSFADETADSCTAWPMISVRGVADLVGRQHAGAAWHSDTIPAPGAVSRQHSRLDKWPSAAPRNTRSAGRSLSNMPWRVVTESLVDCRLQFERVRELCACDTIICPQEHVWTLTHARTAHVQHTAHFRCAPFQELAEQGSGCFARPIPVRDQNARERAMHNSPCEDCEDRSLLSALRVLGVRGVVVGWVTVQLCATVRYWNVSSLTW